MLHLHQPGRAAGFGPGGGLAGRFGGRLALRRAGQALGVEQAVGGADQHHPRRLAVHLADGELAGRGVHRGVAQLEQPYPDELGLLAPQAQPEILQRQALGLQLHRRAGGVLREIVGEPPIHLAGQQLGLLHRGGQVELVGRQVEAAEFELARRLEGREAQAALVGELFASIGAETEVQLGRRRGRQLELAQRDVEILDRLVEGPGGEVVGDIDPPATYLELAELHGQRGGLFGGLAGGWRGGFRYRRSGGLGDQRQQADAPLPVAAHGDFGLVQRHAGDRHLFAEGRQPVDGHLQRRQLDRRRAVGVLDFDRLQAHAALDVERRRAARGLLEAGLQAGRQARAGQAEGFLHRQVGQIAGQVEAFKLEVDHRLPVRREGLGLAADLEGRVVHLHRQQRLDEGLDLGRQVGDEGHAQLQVGHHVLQPRRAVVELDAALLDADVMHREVALRAVVRLGEHLVDHVRPVVALALEALHTHHRLDELDLLHHRPAAEERLQFDVGVQRGKAQRRRPALALQHPQAAHLGRQGVGVDRQALDAHRAMEQLGELGLGHGFNQRRRDEKARHPHQRHRPDAPQGAAQPAAAGGLARAGTGLGCLLHLACPLCWAPWAPQVPMAPSPWAAMRRQAPLDASRQGTKGATRRGDFSRPRRPDKGSAPV